MILAKIQFGNQPGRAEDELEDLAEAYLSALINAGQLWDHYFLGWFQGLLHAHVGLACSQARQAKYHSGSGLKRLAELTEAFGQTPQWTLIDDDVRKRDASWRRAPFLYLFTHAFNNWVSPVRRGDNGKPIPVCLLPISFEQKEYLYWWQGSYFHHDNIWLGCGTLEVAAYRQMADPKSELSEDGRDLCREIERATGVPTFYYLDRYWRRKAGEEDRRCPVCGGRWWSKRPASGMVPFWQFDFRCDRCRIVSHFGVRANGGRHTKIGEYPEPKQHAKKDFPRLRQGRDVRPPSPR